MSYDFTIGNAVPYWPEPDDANDCDEPSPGWRVEEVELPEAPAYEGEPLSAHRNVRCPGYSQWGEFVRLAGIADLFDYRGELLPKHPGIAPLRPRHLVAVREALSRWRTRHNAPAGFGPQEDGVLARLLWLEWWMDWALRTCERPAVENT